MKDAKGNLTVQLYDGLDRLWRTHYPMPATPNQANGNDYEELGYDANDNILTARRRDGQTVSNTWDRLDRLVARTYASAPADNVQYAYDLRGLRTAAQYANSSHTLTYTWDNAARLIRTQAADKILTHQYDAAGNRIRTTWPDGFYTTTSYDALNRATSIKENGLNNLASYSYDDLSRRTSASLGNASSIQRSYDAQGALATLKNFLASPAQEVQYTYTRNQLHELKKVGWWPF